MEEEVENTGELYFFIIDILLKLVLVKFYIEYSCTTYYITLCLNKCEKDQWLLILVSMDRTSCRQSNSWYRAI